MNLRQIKKTQVFSAVLMILFAWAAPLFAQESMDDSASGDFVHSRNYVGLVGVYAGIDKNQDFNGTQAAFNFVTGSTVEVDGIPSFNNGYGFGVLLGHREGSYAGELSFLQTYHTASFTDGVNIGQNTAIYHTINFDLKRYFFEKFPAQPFVSLGINCAWIDVQSASALVDLSTSTIVGEGDMTLDGLGLNLGAGLEIYLGQGFSLVGGAYERFTAYSGLVGIERKSETLQSSLADSLSLNSTGLNFVIGTTIELN